MRKPVRQHPLDQAEELTIGADPDSRLANRERDQLRVAYKRLPTGRAGTRYSSANTYAATTRASRSVISSSYLALRIAQRILALTIGVLLNTLAGRPARALAAYDGR